MWRPLAGFIMADRFHQTNPAIPDRPTLSPLGKCPSNGRRKLVILEPSLQSLCLLELGSGIVR